MNTNRLVWIIALALAGWALCFATIGIGMAVTTQNNALVAHATLAPAASAGVAAPLFFIGLSWLFFRRFPDAAPLATAFEFIAIVMAMDLFVVALLILHSLAMFASLLGTWIPFALIWAATYLTGVWLARRPKTVHPASHA